MEKETFEAIEYMILKELRRNGLLGLLEGWGISEEDFDKYLEFAKIGYKKECE